MLYIIIFDIDDTLIETFNYSFNLFQKLAGTPLDKNIFLQNYTQPNWFEKNLQYFFPNQNIEEIKLTYEKLKKTLPRKILINLDLFYNLKNRWFKFGILTNWPANKTTNKLKQIWFKENDFEIILHGGNLKYPKPNPKAFDPILTNFPKNKIFYIWDSLDDFQAAKSANIQFRAVLTWIATKQDFQNSWLDEKNIFSDVNQVLKKFL